MARKVSELVVKLTDQVTGPAAKMQAALKKAQSDMSKVGAYRDQKAALDKMAAAQEKARENVRQLAAAMMAADAPTKKMQAAYERAVQAADKLGNKLKWQEARVRGAASSLDQMGVSVNKLVSGENALRAAMERTSAAMARQQARAERWRHRRDVAGTMLAGAGVMAGHRAKGLAKKASTDIAEFNIATLKQQEFVDISAKDQAELLIPQAMRIGQDTQFTNLDIVKAQTKAMQGLPSGITGRMKAEVAAGLIENVKNYALVMEADMETAAEAIRSYLQATGKDISTKEKALFEANKATNQLVRMAKLGGMSDEDVQQYMKYAAASGTAAGLTPESMMAIGALARRGGLRGDEAGVFMRATASKLVSPTKDGMAALNAVGINHSKFVGMPDRLSVDALEGQAKLNMGMTFNAKTRAKLEKVLGDKNVIGDRGNFNAAVIGAIEGQMPKTKKGAMRPQDRKAIAKFAGKFYQMSAETIDAEGLLDAVMSSNMTLAQLNAFLTNKHGGKGAITQRQREEYIQARKQLRESGDDPDFAKKKADHIMSGVGGAMEQAKGAVENFTLNLGKANEGLIKFSLETFSGALDRFGRLSEEAQRAATYVGALGVAVGGVVGSAKLLGLLTGGGSAAALTGSAAALDASAAALTVAAAKLAGGDIPGVPGTSPKAKPKSGIGKLAGGAVLLGYRALPMLALGYGMYDLISKGDEPDMGDRDTVAPGQAHNWGRERRKAYEEERRRRHQAFKQQYEGTATASELGIGAVGGIGGFGFGAHGTNGQKSIVDTSQIEAAKDKATEAKEAFDGLNTTANPAVNLSSIMQLKRELQEIEQLMSRIGAGANAAKASVAGIKSAASTGRGRSEVAQATARLQQSRLSNEQDRPTYG